MVSSVSVVKGVQSCLHSLLPNVMGLDPGPTRFVKCLERIPPFLFPDAVAHDVEQGGGEGKGCVVLQTPVDRHQISLPRSLTSCCADGLSSLLSMIRRKRSRSVVNPLRKASIWAWHSAISRCNSASVMPFTISCHLSQSLASMFACHARRNSSISPASQSAAWYLGSTFVTHARSL